MAENQYLKRREAFRKWFDNYQRSRDVDPASRMMAEVAFAEGWKARKEIDYAMVTGIDKPVLRLVPKTDKPAS